jgi:hypothetical protein
MLHKVLLGTLLVYWMAYCTCPGWLWWWRIWWNKDCQGKPKYSEKTCPSATLSTTTLTGPAPGLTPGRRGGTQATNRLSYGAADYYHLLKCNFAFFPQTKYFVWSLVCVLCHLRPRQRRTSWIPPTGNIKTAASQIVEAVWHATWRHLNGVVRTSIPPLIPTLQPLILYRFIDFITHRY